MEDVSCETDDVYREATYTLSHVTLPEVWLDKKSASKSIKSPASYHVTASDDLNPDAFLTPVGTRKTTGVKTKERLCRKKFRTTGTLDTHLLIHRPEKLHTCDICSRVLKQHQFMSHMSTHHNRKTYHCTYSDCHKTYNDQNSLKNHCALRHGVRITSPSSDSPTSCREPVDTPAVSKLQSYNTDLHGFFNSPQNLISPNVAKSFSNSKETHPSKVKPSKRQPSWTLAAASKSYDFKERDPISWTPSVPHTLQEDRVVISLNDSDFESSPDLLELFPRKMSSLEPSKVTATATVGSSNAYEAEYSQLHCSIQVKKTLNKLKRKRPSFTLNHSALSCPETKSGLIADFPDPVIATLPSTPVIRTPSPVPEGRKRKYNSEDSEKVLTDPAPVPQPSPKRSQTQSPCLVSPSQESPMGATGQEQITCKRRKAVRRTQTQSPCTRGCCGSCEKTEELTPKPSFPTLRMKGPKQKSKRKNSTARIIPVSVPVTQAKAISSMSSPHSGEPWQTRKGLSKRSGRLIQPTISSPPTSPKRTYDHQEAQGPHGGCATRGRSSQLRSPIYLEDHRASPRFPPPPYTPPPMLSPHRPRSGLYFNALLQYQQYPPAADSNLGDVDNTAISIKPRINIGSRFQAEIPPLRNTFYVMYEEHPAQLVWSPRKDLTTNRKTQKKVSELLDMCCSSVLTGGGTNIELALHCLHEVQGNIPAALDLLLMREDFRITGHPLNKYHYTGSDHWTDQEMRLYRKSLEDHGKDFNKIHNVLQTKSVAQCVEYYYISKNLRKFKQRVQAADEKDVEETSVFQDLTKTPPEQTRKSNTRRRGVQKRCPCEEPPLHLDQDREWLPPGYKDTMSKDLYGPSPV